MKDYPKKYSFVRMRPWWDFSNLWWCQNDVIQWNSPSGRYWSVLHADSVILWISHLIYIWSVITYVACEKNMKLIFQLKWKLGLSPRVLVRPGLAHKCRHGLWQARTSTYCRFVIFWLIWDKCQRAHVIMNSLWCIVIWHHRHPVLALALSVSSPPIHRFDPRNFISCTKMHICP